jgi:hypothetical protein
VILDDLAILGVSAIANQQQSRSDTSPAEVVKYVDHDLGATLPNQCA